uniref:Centrosomal protein 72 n=1 Tax=Gopherus evgoodei TaxID=1825980 RepID=A0A8C4VLD3_9SAUR
MSRKCSVMDEEDEAVLNLITKCEWDLSKPLGITGSAKKDPEVEFHSLQNSQEISSPVLSSPKMHTQAQKIFNTLSASRLLCNRTHNGGGQPIQNQTYSAALQKNNGQPNVSLNVSKQETIQESGRNHPPSIQGPGPEEQRPNSKTSDVREVFETHQVATQSANKHLYEATPMEHLLDLVDKYWNGYKSLHCNEKFLSQAGPVLSAMQKSAPADQQKDSATMCQEVNNLVEKKILQSRLSEQDQQYNTKINGLMSELSNSQKDMDILKQRLDQLLEENTNLKAHLLNVEQNVKNADSSSSLHLQLTDLQNETQQLRSENINLKQRLQHYDQIQELTEMLQESHRILVSTNEHLLQELAETRTRHRTEVEQLHWSYNQLKKTMDKHPPSNMDNSRC